MFVLSHLDHFLDGLGQLKHLSYRKRGAKNGTVALYLTLPAYNAVTGAAQPSGPCCAMRGGGAQGGTGDPDRAARCQHTTRLFALYFFRRP